MAILLGPPYNRTRKEIGRMLDAEVRLLLRHRDTSGKLDEDLLLAAQRERQKKSEPSIDPLAELVFIRRMQGWPEYQIERMTKLLRDAFDARQPGQSGERGAPERGGAAAAPE